MATLENSFSINICSRFPFRTLLVLQRRQEVIQKAGEEVAFRKDASSSPPEFFYLKISRVYANIFALWGCLESTPVAKPAVCYGAGVPDLQR